VRAVNRDRKGAMLTTLQYVVSSNLWISLGEGMLVN
jgi:hypothetical protein